MLINENDVVKVLYENHQEGGIYMTPLCVELSDKYEDISHAYLLSDVIDILGGLTSKKIVCQNDDTDSEFVKWQLTDSGYQQYQEGDSNNG